MSHALYAVIVGCACADELAAELLVDKIVLDLLKWTFDEERGEGVHDGDEAFEGKDCSYADYSLFHNAQVYHAPGYVRVVFAKEAITDRGKQYHQSLILLREVFQRFYHLLSHVHYFLSPYL